MSGGGFMENQSQGASQGNQSEAIRYYRALTCRQLLEADMQDPDGPYYIDGAPVENFVLCPVVKEIQERVTDNATSKVVYVWDATGSAGLRIFANTADESLNIHYNEVTEDITNKFVNVYGRILNKSGRKTMNITHIKKDIPAYQFAYHEIEAYREFLHFTKQLSLNDTLDAHNAGNDTKTEGDAKQSQPEEYDVDIERRIIETVRSNDNGDGCHIEFLAREVHQTEAVIAKYVDKMVKKDMVFCNEGSVQLADL